MVILFSSVTMLFTRDFHQLPSVGDDPLYRLIMINKSGMIKSITGHQIWNTCLSDIVILTEQMHVDDLDYYELLQHVQYGKTTVDDYHHLWQQVMDNLDVNNRLLHVPITVTCNNIHTCLNNVAVLMHIHQVHQSNFIFPASDMWAWKSKRVAMQETNLAYVTDDKMEHLPTWLPLMQHQPIMVTANIATELGLVNGTMASMAKETKWWYPSSIKNPHQNKKIIFFIYIIFSLFQDILYIYSIILLMTSCIQWLWHWSAALVPIKMYLE